AKVVGYIPLEENGAKIAATREKLLVALPVAQKLVRYDLATRKREADADLVLKPKDLPCALAAGCASDGPVLVMVGTHNSGQTYFVDLATLRPIDYKVTGEWIDKGNDVTRPYASADGRTFAYFQDFVVPLGVQTLVLQGNEVRAAYTRETPLYAIPS